MCQKASSAFALGLVSVRDNHVEWTRGQISWFKSSNVARRGFCNQCGTPIAYDASDGLALALLAFDKPEKHPPVRVYGIEGKPAFVDDIPLLKQSTTQDDAADDAFLSSMESYQHPDFDT
jgi:hypothetical protein